MKATLEQLLSQKLYPGRKEPPSHSPERYKQIQQQLRELNTAVNPHIQALQMDIKKHPLLELKNELRKLLRGVSERVALIQLIGVFLALKSAQADASQSHAMA